MKPGICPNCAGADTERGRKHPWKNTVTPRVCRSCGHEWEPAPPVWAMAFFAMGGCVGLVIAALRFSFASEFMPFRITMFGLGMLLVFGVGIAGLVRRRPKTLVQGRTRG